MYVSPPLSQVTRPLPSVEVKLYGVKADVFDKEFELP